MAVACWLWVTAVLPATRSRWLLLAVDGDTGGIAGWFTHEAIDYELQECVVAWYQPWRLCVRVVIITVLTLALTCTE